MGKYNPGPRFRYRRQPAISKLQRRLDADADGRYTPEQWRQILVKTMECQKGSVLDFIHTFAESKDKDAVEHMAFVLCLYLKTNRPGASIEQSDIVRLIREVLAAIKKPDPKKMEVNSAEAGAVRNPDAQ